VVYLLLGREFRAGTEPSVADGTDFDGSRQRQNSTKDGVFYCSDHFISWQYCV